MLLESLEHLEQEAVGKEHTARLDVDARDVVLGRYGLDGVAHADVVDECARLFGLHRVEQAYGDVVQAGRQHAGRVQDFCAEIGQLGGLLEVQLADGTGALHIARIVVVHAVDVGPDIYLVGLDGGADD